MDTVSTAEMHAVVNRLKRAQGQLGGIVRMIEEGRDCSDVVTQLSAVHRALGRAGFDVIALNMRECLADPDPERRLDLDELRRLFMSLA
ncbi:metal-sensitive transcriptional regulator [Knoellia sp. p5-6-4]|uniref:metal-sensitive transcriptional regulator n=1 Tax=unclassified Knoellia TaxID=2618719 RepID=UPI0023D9D955|nr:metal-sensitive transcriptional regulator [Knoellia sp. p5-6-4]MDF2145188.1 metal-sensitive transcriptional regulator [Knoellia sp. p5-6-4]